MAGLTVDLLHRAFVSKPCNFGLCNWKLLLTTSAQFLFSWKSFLNFLELLRFLHSWKLVKVVINLTKIRENSWKLVKIKKTIFTSFHEFTRNFHKNFVENRHCLKGSTMFNFYIRHQRKPFFHLFGKSTEVTVET